MAESRVITIPNEYLTVQEGLDQVVDGDTLFLRLGVYEEALTAPPFSLTMIGEFSSDSSGSQMPLVDASNLELPDSISVLYLPENSSAVVNNVGFRNEGRAGVTCLGNEIEMSNCAVIESNRGLDFPRLDHETAVVLRDCSFLENTISCVRIRNGDSFIAENCVFSPVYSVWSTSAVIAGGGFIDSCVFTSDTKSQMLALHGESISVRNCRFGPVCAGWSGESEVVQVRGGAITLEGNEFVDCWYAGKVLRVVTSTPDSVLIFNNRFTRCAGVDSLLTPSGVLDILNDGIESSDGLVVGGNTFTECSSNQMVDDIFVIPFFPALIENNRFIRDAQNGLPSIRSGSPFQPSPLTLRNNVWEDCGYAASLYPPADARSNYWGDPSGPYHEFENPGGLGDTVTGSMLFVPWLEDTVTSVEDRSPEVIEEFSIRAFPNPFNSRVTIEFTTARLQEMELKIFDIQGRLVADLLNETRSSGSYTIEWDALATASGTYFARLTGNSVWSASKVIKLALIK